MGSGQEVFVAEADVLAQRQGGTTPGAAAPGDVALNFEAVPLTAAQACLERDHYVATLESLTDGRSNAAQHAQVFDYEKAVAEAYRCVLYAKRYASTRSLSPAYLVVCACVAATSRPLRRNSSSTRCS